MGTDEKSTEYLSREFGLSGRVALVTGSTRGIGEGIARALSAAGAAVIVHGRDRRQAERVAHTIGAVGIEVADLAVEHEVTALCERVLAQHPVLDLIVNNAGLEIGSRVETMNAVDLRTTFAVNLEAPLALVQGLLPALRRSSSASVINVSSIHETVPSWGNSAYASSKAALAMVTKTLAIELGPEGIRVNGIAPGAIATDINADVIDEIGEDQFREWIPLGRVGEPDDIGPAAVFLASAAARYLTGSTLVIDGGYSHHLVRYRHSDHA